MKATITLLVLFALFLPNSRAQEYTQWELPKGAKARLGKGSINEIKYSPDGTRLAVAGSIGIWLYDTATHQEVALLTEHTDRTYRGTYSVAFSPNGNSITSGGSDNRVRLWSAQTGEHPRILTGHTGEVTSVAFSPDGNTIASGSGDKTVRLWDTIVEEGKTLTGHTSLVTSVAFSPDGNTIASGSWDRTIRLWDAETGHTQANTHWTYEFGH